MSRKPKFNLKFRPATYWPDRQGPINVKGQWRREQIREAIAQGELEDVPELVLADSLDSPLREFVGRIHPSMMGGEYLPDYLEGEVEIARICFRSTTGDVTSIRARPCGKRIKYRVVDEYEGDFDHEIRPRSSSRPLTMGQMIRLIDTSYDRANQLVGLIEPFWDFVSDGGLDGVRGFIRVESSFYPELSWWCGEKEAEYIATGAHGKYARPENDED